MTQSFLARLRRLWLTLHLWIGVGLMVLLVPLSVSGAVLVWHDAIDHSLYAKRYAVSGPEAARPPSAYAIAAQRAFGDRAALTQLRLPFKAGDPVVAVGRLTGPPGANGRPRTLNAWIDPPTGRVLATAEIAATPTMVIHRLHGSLLVPSRGGPGVGRQIVGWLGWAMFISSATGLWLWWPRHAGPLKGLRWRRGASQLFNLHHAVGFWLCLPLAALSLSGVYIAFPQTSHALVGAPPPPSRGGANRQPDTPPLAAPRLTADQAVAAALTQAPGARLSTLNLPLEGKAPAWRIELAPAGGGKPVTLRVDDATGEAKVPREPTRDAVARQPGPDPFSRWVRRLHDGADMGLAWRLIITVAGAAPLLLSLSGLVMWLRRRARRLNLRPRPTS